VFYHATLGPPRPDGLTLVQLKFGDPANNDLIVPDAIKAIQDLNLKGGPGILFDGKASLPVAMAIAHLVAHLYQFVACADPKMGKFVVVISHTPDHRPGDLIE
jgi:CRISPR-associated protein Csx3